MAELNLQINASGNDGEYSTFGGGEWNTNDGELGVSAGTFGPRRIFLRFTNVTIAQGETINEATLSMTPGTTRTPGIGQGATIYAVDDAGSTNQMPTSPADALDEPLTSASTFWDFAAWNSGVREASPDLAAVIQEIVDRPDWVSGNSIIITTQGVDGSSPADCRAVSYDASPTAAAILSITYGEGAGGPVGLDGQSMTITQERASYPGARTCLMMVADPNNLSAVDAAVKARLETVHLLTVTLVADENITVAMANGYDLVYQSKSGETAQMQESLKSTTAAYLTGEDNAQMLGDMAFISDDGSGGTAWHFTGTQLFFGDSTAPSDLRNGETGTVTVYSSSGNISYADSGSGLAAGAIRIAEFGSEGSDQWSLYVIDEGVTLADGTPAAGRRAFNGMLYDDTFGLLTADGLALFDAQVDWLLGVEPLVTVVGSDSAVGFSDSISVTVPASAQANDLVLIYASTSRWPQINDPAGFGRVEVLSGTGNSLDSKLVIFSGIVGVDCAAGEAIAVGDVGGGANNYSAVLVCLRGDNGNPPGFFPADITSGVSSLANPGNTAPTAPSVSAPEDGILVFGASIGAAVDMTAPSGYTLHDTANRTAASVLVASKAVAAGATGTATASSGTGGAWNASHLLVYEADAVADTTDPTTTLDSIHGAGPVDSVHNASGYDAEANVLTLSGTSADNVGVDRVEVRVDGGSWLAATGTTSWSYDLDMSGVSSGQHAVEVRAVDTSENVSAVVGTSFWYAEDGVWGAASVAGDHLIPMDTEGV